MPSGPAAGQGPTRREWPAVCGLLLAVLAVAAAAAVLARKAGYEGAQRGPVEIVMDWPALQAAAREWADNPAAAAALLAQEGVTTLGLPERTAGEVAERGEGWLVSAEQWEMLGRAWLAASGREGVQTGGEARSSWPFSEHGNDDTLSALLRPGLSVLLRPDRPPLVVPAPLPEARAYGVGLPPDGLAAARAAGLAVLPRYADGPRLAGGREELSGLTVSRVALYEGTRVGSAEQLLELWGPGAGIGLIEFASQEGSGELARELGLRAVAVHSMRAEEVARLGPRATAARYVRAVRERGVRVLYLRPAATLEQTRAMARQIRDELSARGFRIGLWQQAPPFTGPGPFEVAVLAAGVAGTGVLGLAGWGVAAGRPQVVARLQKATLLAGVALAAGLGLLHGAGWERPASVVARQAGALLAALVTPMAATGVALGVARRQLPGEVEGPAGAGVGLGLLGAGAAFLAVTAAGGMTVGALLGDSQFMLRLEQFRGVKAAHVLPPLGVAAATAGALGWGPRAWLRGLGRPVRWAEVLAGVAVLAAAAYYVARTGNELAAVAGGERALRSWLEAALPARPRLKEFLLGYPALGAALALWASPLARRLPAAMAALSAAASVASISVVNSWAHAHTPVAVSLARVVSGLALGAPAGLAAWAGVRVVVGRLGGQPSGTLHAALGEWRPAGAGGPPAATAGSDRPAGAQQGSHGSVAS